jgi:hypothetical protein
MPVHWYKCRNISCRNFNREFTLIFDSSSSVESCPNCHGRNIERQTKKELENRKYKGIEV